MKWKCRSSGVSCWLVAWCEHVLADYLFRELLLHALEPGKSKCCFPMALKHGTSMLLRSTRSFFYFIFSYKLKNPKWFMLSLSAKEVQPKNSSYLAHTTPDILLPFPPMLLKCSSTMCKRKWVDDIWAKYKEVI